MSDKFKPTLFDLNDGDKFLWQESKYQLLRIDTHEGVATVLNCSTNMEENFNPYATVVLVIE